MDFNLVYNKLPKELADKVSEYNAYHRLLMNEVFEELDDYCNIVCCDNEYCEKNGYYTFHKNNAYKELILNNMCYFCSETCLGEGGYWIRYDYRKSMRRARQLEM